MHHDPYWPRAGEWLAKGSVDPIVAIQGVPLNNSITPGRCDEAPAAIRGALNYFGLGDVQHFTALDQVGVLDQGDSLQIAPYLSPTILLGGDNGVTFHGVHALGIPLDRVGLITLDAHFDLRHLENGLNNGNPIRALLRDGLPGPNILQIGIQSFANSSDYAMVASDAGIHVITAREVHEAGVQAALDGVVPDWDVDSIYVDLDIDALDRAYCPGAPGARPGGLAPWQVQDFAFAVGSMDKVRAMDIVEFDPHRDINMVTAMSCASAMLHFISGVMSRS